MGMQNFTSLASTQTDLDTFLTNFVENLWIFQENSLANSKKIQTWGCNFIFKEQSMGMQNFSTLGCTQTDLDTFLTISKENFKKTDGKKF
jgi:hypothetical protein